MEDEEFDDSYFDQYLDGSNNAKPEVVEESFSIVAEPALNPAALSSVNEPIGPVFEFSAPKQNISISKMAGAAPYPLGYHKPNVTPQVMEKLGINAKKPSKVYKIKAPTSSSGGSKNTILRKGGGEVWKDATMLDWDPNDFRIFVGDLGNEATDELLYKTFNRYSSIQKARVIRDKKTGKTKGYGFVSFKDATDYLNALKEMDGTFLINKKENISGRGLVNYKNQNGRIEAWIKRRLRLHRKQSLKDRRHLLPIV